MKKKMICGFLVLSVLVGATGCVNKSVMNTAPSDVAANYTTEEVWDGGYVTSDCDVSEAYGYADAANGYANESYPSAECIIEGDCWDEYYAYGEKYNAVAENTFCNALSSPLSTFAADVDTASYSNFRRFVNDGYSLGSFPCGSIRTEEMVNYFTYSYEQPKKGDVFGVNGIISNCPWNKDAKLLMVGVNTAQSDKKELPASNIVFLVDVSGSMQDENKLELIKKSMKLLVENFNEDDRISIVTYASGVECVLDGCPGDKQSKIVKAFRDLKAGGSTNGGDGIKLAYEVAEENFIDGGVNRVIICSDGDFNVGLTTQDELEKLITSEKESGIFLTTLGFGMYNYSDVTMETLADCGNGNYAYIDTLAEAKKVLIDEMTSVMVTVAKDVKLQVEFNPAMVSEYRLIGYENRTMAAADFKDDTKDGGELGAGHQVTAVYEIILNKNNEEGTQLKYQDNTVSDKGISADEYCTVSIAYKEPDGKESYYLEYPIGTECYTKKPNEDFIFAAMVVETSLAIRNSEYLKDYDAEGALEQVKNTLKKYEFEDEYKNEFKELVNNIYTPEDLYYWYED